MWCDAGWRFFDDHKVTTASESQVVTRSAYVLFYRRCDSFVPVPRSPAHVRDGDMPSLPVLDSVPVDAVENVPHLKENLPRQEVTGESIDNHSDDKDNTSDNKDNDKDDTDLEIDKITVNYKWQDGEDTSLLSNSKTSYNSRHSYTDMDSVD